MSLRRFSDAIIMALGRRFRVWGRLTILEFSMINDSDPNFGRGFRMSSEQLQSARRAWREAGEQVWNVATRVGRNIQARTGAELEALGRAHLEAERTAREYEGAHGAQRGKDLGDAAGAPSAVSPLRRNYNDMVQADWIGADKYFHCKGNCEAAQRGPLAVRAAERLGNAREIYGRWKGDPPSDKAADQRANAFGRQQGSRNPGAQCSALCASYRPHGLPDRY
ncbi:hypothetical protein ACO2Q0_03115 [Phenylobacterium sp. VNQ135]|uniref:hypothetical protein n=1 Tax=Phenylobacterium sp. VNQ135 TaxID=3400922 RepID=UPI003C0BADE8